MVILSKACKPDNFVLCNSLKRSFTNIQDLCSNFVDCKSFIESNSPDILALCKTNLHDSVDSGNFSARCYLLLIQKDYYTYAWSCSSCERRTSFCTGLISRKLCGFLHIFSASFTSLSVLLLFPLSITFFVVMHGFLFYFI